MNIKSIKNRMFQSLSVVKRDAILIASVSAIMFLLINTVINTSKSQSIVIFDKASVFNDYYAYLKKLESTSKTPLSQNFLDKKNRFFIKALTTDLSDYQNDFHVIIVKKSALEAPIALLGSKNDITKIIEGQLKLQGTVL